MGVHFLAALASPARHVLYQKGMSEALLGNASCCFHTANQVLQKHVCIFLALAGMLPGRIGTPAGTRNDLIERLDLSSKPVACVISFEDLG